MLNKIAKLMLVATSLAPVLGAYGILGATHGQSGWFIAQWFFYAALLWILCALILRFGTTNAERHNLTIKTIRNSDKETLAFLLTYLLPLIARDTIGIGNPLTAAYVIGIIGWAVYHSNAFSFNPLLSLLDYHFYEIDPGSGITVLLISRRTILTTSEPIDAVRLFEYTYLELKAKQ